MKLSDFDYILPEGFIAQEPKRPRDDAKLMVYKRNTDEIIHAQIKDLPGFLPKDSFLLVNRSKVIKARIFGTVDEKERVCEILLHKPIDKTKWQVLVKPGKYFKIGAKFRPNNFTGKAFEIEDILDSGERILNTFFTQDKLAPILDRIGQMPLPHYIDSFTGDEEEYQTPFGQKDGSVACPTASLHFTPDLTKNIKDKGINFLNVILHVGLGTFQLVKTENINDHDMHSEFFEVPGVTIDTLRNKPEITAVGTTALRAIESIDINNPPTSLQETKLFLKPRDEIKYVDHLLTNFHLPKSTLLMLVACFLSQGQSPEFGIQKVQELYKEAIANNYRFYSFGDAMLIL